MGSKRPLGVFTRFGTSTGPGLDLSLVGKITLSEGRVVECVDVHAPMEPTPGWFDNLGGMLAGWNLSLSAVVFGFPGENWDSPARARETVGFAAPGDLSARIEFCARLIKLTTKQLSRDFFVGDTPVWKGHFGALPQPADSRYREICDAVRQVGELAGTHDGRLLGETGCETAGQMLDFFGAVNLPGVICANVDTANLAIWGARDESHRLIPWQEYTRALAGHVAGIHVKGGRASAERGEWGTEIDPPPELLTDVVAVLNQLDYEGPVVVEREMFLGKTRETQEQKQHGIEATLRSLINLGI